MTAAGATALVIGAGKIGRGFLGQLLTLSGWQVVFVDASESLVEALRVHRGYRIHILGDEDRSDQVSGFDACLLNSSEFDAHWARAEVIFTAAGGRSLGAIASRVAQAYLAQESGSRRVKNIITCENWDQPARQLESAILAQLPRAEASPFRQWVGVTDAVVMRVAVDPPDVLAEDEELDVWTNDYAELPVDASRLRGEPPAIHGLKPLAVFGAFLTRKIYTNNASNAVIAYNGYRAGYRYTADAARSPEIAPLLDRAYEEINAMCVAEFDVPVTEQAEFARQAREKYSNPLIIDPISRHARDPLRKLGPRDRLIGPARLCLRHGITPTVLTTTIVAALRYDNPDDPAAMALGGLIADGGVDSALTEVCQLDPDEPLYRLIREEYLREC